MYLRKKQIAMTAATITHDVTVSEKMLMRHIAAGNFTSYETLFKHYYDVLCHYALSYTGDTASAQDAVSDVFVRIWEKREQLQVETSVKSYLYRAVTNQCIDILRRSYYKKTVLVESLSTYDAPFPNNEAYTLPETKELAATIEYAIRSLPTQCGIIFRLSKEAGLKYQEIAALLNISVKTVETQMGRAFKSLRLKVLGLASAPQISREVA